MVRLVCSKSIGNYFPKILPRPPRMLPKPPVLLEDAPPPRTLPSNAPRASLPVLLLFFNLPRMFIMAGAMDERMLLT